MPVAVLTTSATDSIDTIDAATLDPATIRFGATGVEAAPVRHGFADVDLDGDVDMMLIFNSRDTGIQCGDVSGFLTGRVLGWLPIRGIDSIKVAGCK